MAPDELNTVEMQDLIRNWKRGDRSARDELFQRACKRMEKLTRKMLKSYPNVQRWADPDDVLQESLMRLMRSLAQMEAPDSMRAFYGQAAKEIRRQLIDMARKFFGPEGIGANHQSNNPNADSNSPNLDPADRADRGDFDKWTSFHEEVEKLPPELREVVSLHWYHGFTQTQIAELFGKDERTIRRWWQKALLAIRQALKNEMPLT